MSEERWTEQTETLVTRAFHDDHCPGGANCDDSVTTLHSRWQRNARIALAALADAGLLVAPGGQTWEQYGREGRMFGGDGPPDTMLPFSPDSDGVGASHVRTVTSWPDGTEMAGPWREVKP